MSVEDLIHLIVWPPLVGFILSGLLGNKVPKSLINWISCGAAFLSFVGTLLSFLLIKELPLQVTLYEWFKFGESFSVEFGFYVDSLSMVMLFVVTGVGTLIHVYSVGYMHDDSGYPRFFSYLNLFLFSMILLITGSSLPILFAGWEGVGLCSFLLIGFWYGNGEFNAAARKAFIMNRIGDLGFLIGIFLIAYHFNSLNIQQILSTVSNFQLNDSVIVCITILLFIGVTGKSAQIPLFTWLPDAMAGPTPVSALIHAATMVTAGIYLIARMSGLFELAPITLNVITITGLLTAFIAASIALKQNDIKKVLAYSTVSQLGFMVVALGLGAYITAIFHVVTHAFFKALLFLSAGSVIHGLHGEQDISKMGGIKSKMKWTYLVFLIGTLAIVGCPPFAGFFSKDEILAISYSKSVWYFAILALCSVLTAWYMFRLLFSVFFGNYRGTENTWSKVHESPPMMIIPLVVLAVFSIVGGFIGLPEILHQPHFISQYLSTSVIFNEFLVSHNFEYALLVCTLVALVVIIYVTYKRYSTKTLESYATSSDMISNLLSNKYFIDEIYHTILVKPLEKMAHWFGSYFDFRIVDGLVRVPTKFLTRMSLGIKPLQSGSISWYLLSMVVGLIAFLLLFIVKF
ncbi:MAG: NADH-quinone oxidoreductase subunit L [Bacteroidota bacterium]|nr:NADH-quinone oxidoreductase subunit L [Bacteroidota bacterium]